MAVKVIFWPEPELARSRSGSETTPPGGGRFSPVNFFPRFPPPGGRFREPILDGWLGAPFGRRKGGGAAPFVSAVGPPPPRANPRSKSKIFVLYGEDPPLPVARRPVVSCAPEARMNALGFPAHGSPQVRACPPAPRALGPWGCWIFPAGRTKHARARGGAPDTSLCRDDGCPRSLPWPPFSLPGPGADGCPSLCPPVLRFAVGQCHGGLCDG